MDTPVEFDIARFIVYAKGLFWADVRTKIMVLAGEKEMVPVSEVLRIIDEPAADLMRLFIEAAKGQS